MSDRAISPLVRALAVAALTLLLAAAAAGLLTAQVIGRGLHPYLDEASLGTLWPWMAAALVAAAPIALVAGIAAYLARRGWLWGGVTAVLLLFGGFHLLRETATAAEPPRRADASYPAWSEVEDELRSVAEEVASSDPAADERPDVVLITIDTLRWDHLGFAGYERPVSPRIDELARRGTVFEHALAQAPATRASMASMMVGLYPHVLEIERGRRGGTAGAYVADGFHLLAERLATAGYETAAFITNPYLRAVNGFGQGFEVYDESALFGAFGDERLRNATDVVDAALGWLESRSTERSGGDEPYFLWVHVLDPHHPYEPAEPGPWEDVDSPEFQAFDAEYRAMSVDDMTAHLQALGSGEAELRPGELDYIVGRYDAEILWTDREVGRLLDALEPSTLVLLTSDHGEEFFDHGGLLHSHTLYDELIRVPFVVAGPGFEAGARADRQARLIDVAPTVLAAADLLPATDGGANVAGLAGRPLQSSESTDSAGLSFFSLARVALRTPEHKLKARFADRYDRLCPSDGFAPVDDLLSLFEARYGPPRDLEADLYALADGPDEAVPDDVVPEEGSSADRRRTIHDLRCRMTAKLAANASVTIESSSAAAGLADEDLEHLRALGYVD